jgi:hypothetical protein
MLLAAGYPKNSAGEVEGIRLDEVAEFYFEVKGKYGGNNAIHELAIEDLPQLSIASTIPPAALTKLSAGMAMPVLREEPVTPLAARITPGVERVEVEAIADDRAFDAYVMVDWSSSSSPATGNDSIWLASGTRHGRTFTADPPRNDLTGTPGAPQAKVSAGPHRHKLPDGYRVTSTPVLGGLHHEYWLEKKAA